MTFFSQFVYTTISTHTTFLIEIYVHRWRSVSEPDDSEFHYLEQEVYTNNSVVTRHTLTQLQPFTVYSFMVAAINHVGRSRPSKASYPAITLPESKSAVTSSSSVLLCSTVCPSAVVLLVRSSFPGLASLVVLGFVFCVFPAFVVPGFVVPGPVALGFVVPGPVVLG